MDKKKLQKTKGQMFQGTLDPTSIFPEELWEKILDRVSSLDRLATCRTNSQLDTAFGECKNEWLLDQVLPFLMKHFTEKAHVLKCRQVCKNWRRTVNSFLESEHPCRRFYQKDHPLEQLFCRMPISNSSLRRCCLDRLEHLNTTPIYMRCGMKYIEFAPDTVQKFSSCPDPTRPLVGRAISLHINGWWTEQVVEEFWTAARSFLELQGGALWHFRLGMHTEHWKTVRFYQIIWECLNLLPNLRTLQIHCFPRYLNLSNSQQERDLAQLFAASPLPVPSHLHSLDIDCLPLTIQQHFILQFSTQLKRLSVDKNIFQELECTLPENLVELSVKRISSNDFLRKMYIINRKSILRNLNKLTLDMGLCAWVFDISLLRVLMQYPQLRHFHLIMPFQTSYGEWFQSNKDQVVPGLEYFEIQGYGRDLFYFSTLLHKFPNLKYWHIRDCSSTGPAPNEEVPTNPLAPIEVRKQESFEAAKVEIRQYLYSNKLEESPIWDTLDQLQVLTYQSRDLTRFCNREQVKYYREQMGFQRAPVLEEPRSNAGPDLPPDVKLGVEQRLQKFTAEDLDKIRAEINHLKVNGSWDRNVGRAPLSCNFLEEIFNPRTDNID